LASGATLVLESQDVLDAYRFLHHDRIDEKAFLEAKQHTDLTPSEAGRFGLHLSAQAVRAREERAERRVAKKERREAMRAAAETPVDTSCLSDRQKQIYALLPDAPFSVDALADRGVPVEEAISAMTLLEIYGMVTSRPGGLYQKK
jgi:predicted Rossmann fold nucleotide-binding protein DprA/Smf involved in DNA uptake